MLPPRPASQWTTGVATSGPTGSSRTGSAAAEPVAATAARAAGVRCLKTSRVVIRSPARRAREIICRETMESPPRSKKLSSGPTAGSPSASAKTAQSVSSVWVAGARPVVPAATTGAGSALRSSLPLEVSGRTSSATNAAGTM